MWWVDLCGVLGACIVVRVAAAGAESATDPLMNGLEDGVVFYALFWVGILLVGLGIAETLVCEVPRVRVSLVSCSGAIHG